MQIKRKLDEDMTMINNSTEEIPLKSVLEGVTVEVVMPTMVEDETNSSRNSSTKEKS